MRAMPDLIQESLVRQRYHSHSHISPFHVTVAILDPSHAMTSLLQETKAARSRHISIYIANISQRTTSCSALRFTLNWTPITICKRCYQTNPRVEPHFLRTILISWVQIAAQSKWAVCFLHL